MLLRLSDDLPVIASRGLMCDCDSGWKFLRGNSRRPSHRKGILQVPFLLPYNARRPPRIPSSGRPGVTKIRNNSINSSLFATSLFTALSASCIIFGGVFRRLVLHLNFFCQRVCFLRPARCSTLAIAIKIWHPIPPLPSSTSLLYLHS